MSQDPYLLPHSSPTRHRTSSLYSAASAHADAHPPYSPAPSDQPLNPLGSPSPRMQDYPSSPPSPAPQFAAPSHHPDAAAPDEVAPLYPHSPTRRSMSPYSPGGPGTANPSATVLGSSTQLADYPDAEKAPVSPVRSNKSATQPAPRSRKRWLIALAVALIAIIAVAVGVYLAVHNKHTENKNSSASDNSGGGSGSSGQGGHGGSNNSSQATSGGDGSIITTEDGTTFVYKNALGGHWTSIPFDNSAQAQSSVPALSDNWDYANDRILGVNVGGWLLLEPFIAPALFEPFENDTDPAIDEWTLAGKLGNQFASTMENHYATFITEQDFAQIAGAGLNWVRIPIPYWAIETLPGEPFVEGVAWTYFLKAITWARKYGLRINLDYHATPGSQNGWNHSSKYGSVNFLAGVMGMANAQRALNYLRTMTEFISQPQYSPVVPMFSIMNEALLGQIGGTVMRSFYLEAYNMIRSISGFGEGKGPMITIHDGFIGKAVWAGFLDGADRIALDTHPYLCFAPQANTNTMQQNIMTPCQSWGPGYNTSFGAFGFSMAGEWSLAVNDCGEYVNNVGWGTREEGTFPNATDSTTTRVGSCAPWVDASSWSDELKGQFQQLQFAHQDGLQNSFFWTWKVGNTTKTNPPRCANPMWSYSTGLEMGFINPNPLLAKGSCRAMAQQFGVAAPSQATWPGQFKPYQTGTAQNPQIAADQLSTYGTWPPTALQGGLVVASLPVYTPTGAVITAPVSTPTAGPSGTVGAGNGWNQPTDTAGWFTSINGCDNYLNPWSGNGAAMPTNNAGCTAGAAAAAAKRRIRGRAAEPTPVARRHASHKI